MAQIMASISRAILAEVSTVAPLGKTFRIRHSGPELPEPMLVQPRKYKRSSKSLRTVMVICCRRLQKLMNSRGVNSRVISRVPRNDWGIGGQRYSGMAQKYN